MIVSTSASVLAQALSQDAAQSSARVAIDRFKDVVFTVFKVLKPSSQTPVEILADRSHAPPFCASGFATNRLFEFVHAFLARPLSSPFKMIAQEVEPSG